MKKGLAVVVSILWLALIVGIPALVLTGNATQWIPAALLEPIQQVVGPELLSQLGLNPATPTPASNEPVVVVDTPTPAPIVEPTATLPPPSPTPVPQPTATPEAPPTPTSAPAETVPPAVTFPVAVRGQADLRTGPGLNFDAVGLVDAGATILVSAQDETGEWFQMDNGDWIPAEALASKPPVPIVIPGAAIATAAPTPTTPPVESVPTATPATPVVVRVNADANLRSGPGSTFERVGGASFGSDVTVVGKFATDNWYLLDTGAWIFGELLESAPDVPEVNADGTPVGSAPTAGESAPTPAPIAVTDVTTPTANILANLRAAPNTTAPLTGTAQPGQALSLVGKNVAGDWLKLESGSWIFAELVDNVPADLPIATEDAAPAAEAPAAAAPAAGSGATSSAAVDANLRTGPGTTFDLAGSITAGTALTIIARNEAGDWLKLDSGVWIFGELVTNPPADLPVATS